MEDNLYLSRKTVPETNTGFSAFLSPQSSVSSSASLQSLVGYVPANFNVVPWGAFWQYTDFTDVRFSLAGATVSSGTFTSPVGTSTARSLIEDTSNGIHAIGTPLTSNIELNTQTEIPYRIATIVETNGRNRIVLSWGLVGGSTPDPTGTASFGFDLAGGNTGYNNVSTAHMNALASSMTSLGSGWWLCTADFALNPAGFGSGAQKYQALISLDNGSGTNTNSTSYTGDGSSGVKLWWFNVLPVAAWNIHNLSFFDDFNDLSSIDLNNTKANGFNWYVDPNWPNSPFTAASWVVYTDPTPASNLSISSPSVLKIYNPNANQNGYTSWIMTAVSTGGASYHASQLFQPPMVYDAYVNYDGLRADWSGNWGFISPAFWCNAIEILVDPATTEYFEWDVIEAGQPDVSNISGLVHIHDGTASGGGNYAFYSSGNFMNINMTLGNFRRTGGMWLTQAATGVGWGTVLSFVDGTFVNRTDMAYGATHTDQPFGSRVGAFTIGETQHFPVILDTAENSNNNPGTDHSAGTGWPFYIDWVKVYT